MQTATNGPERAASLSSHPRRASPANSLTLQNHFGLNRDASLRASLGSARSKPSNVHSPRRNSSGDSHKTGQSDPKKWFDRSNENPTATFDSNVMEGMHTQLPQGKKIIDCEYDC